MALVNDLRLQIAVRSVKIPQQLQLLRRLADQRLYEVKLVTYLVDANGLRLTADREHIIIPGEGISYGPIAAPLDVTDL